MPEDNPSGKHPAEESPARQDPAGSNDEKRISSQRRQLMQLSGLGVELAAAVAGLGALGYGIDHYYGSDPWGLLIGGSLGIVGGLYNFVRAAKRAFRGSRGAGPKR